MHKTDKVFHCGFNFLSAHVVEEKVADGAFLRLAQNRPEKRLVRNALFEHGLSHARMVFPSGPTKGIIVLRSSARQISGNAESLQEDWWYRSKKEKRKQ